MPMACDLDPSSVDVRNSYVFGAPRLFNDRLWSPEYGIPEATPGSLRADMPAHRSWSVLLREAGTYDFAVYNANNSVTVQMSSSATPYTPVYSGSPLLGDWVVSESGHTPGSSAFTVHWFSFGNNKGMWYFRDPQTSRYTPSSVNTTNPDAQFLSTSVQYGTTVCAFRRRLDVIGYKPNANLVPAAPATDSSAGSSSERAVSSSSRAMEKGRCAAVRIQGSLGAGRASGGGAPKGAFARAAAQAP